MKALALLTVGIRVRRHFVSKWNGRGQTSAHGVTRPTWFSDFLRLTYLATLVLGGLMSVSARGADSGPQPVRGTTVDGEGKPLGEVMVEQYGYVSSMGAFELEKLQETTSDANGGFELQTSHASALPGGAMFFIARKPGLAPGWVQIAGPVAKTPRLVSTPVSFLAGKVVDEADKPVAGAQVTVAAAFNELQGEGANRSFNFLNGKPARELFPARTDAEGRFRIENFPTNASAMLVAEAPGKVQRSDGQVNFSPDSMPCRPGQEDIRLVVEPAGSIEGKIVAEKAGENAPAATVNVMAEGPAANLMGTRPPVQAAKDGTFRIENLAAGNYRVQAAFGTNGIPKWTAELVSVTVESGQAAKGMEVVATRGGLLEISVRSAKDAKPVDQVNVNLYAAKYQTGLLSDSNGLVTLRLPVGSYQANGYKHGWQQGQVSATVEAGVTNRAEIELAPPRKLAGIVRSPDGMPAANLAVRVVGDYSMQQASIKSDSEGKFEMDWPVQRFPGNNMIPCLFIRDPERNLAVAQDLDDEVGQLDLRLAPAVSFVAEVESNGKAITNASAVLVFWTGNSGMHLNDLVSRTDKPGQVEVIALPLDRRYALQVSAPGHGTKYVDLSQNTTEAKRIELDPVELKKADRKLAGKFVDAEDKPIAGATIQINGDGQPSGNIRTDKEGRFSFDVCEGPVQLFASAQNTFANKSAQAGDTNVVMKMGEQSMGYGGDSKPQKVKGLVKDSFDNPVAGADVRVLPADTPGQRTDTNGAFAITYVLQPWQRQNGNPLVFVRDRAHNLAGTLELLKDDTNVVIRLEPGLIVRGRVVGLNAEPLAKAQISLTLQAGSMSSSMEDQPVTTDAEGRFTFKALPVTETYAIDVSLPGYGQHHQTVDALWDTNLVEMPPITLRVPNQVIAGQVVDGKEKPVAGAQVQIASNDQPQESAQTDRKGRFKFKVCEGQVRVYANGPNGFGQTTVQAGDTNIVILLTDRSTRGPRNREPKRRKAAASAALKGKALPDLTSLGFATDAAPPGKPVLLCLLDVQQRPSRRIARLLTEQQDELRQKGLVVLAVQAAPANDEAWADWKEIDPGLSSMIRLTEKSDQNKWASGLESLPWLVLTDKEGVVADEGFPLEQLEAKLQALSK